MYNGMEVKPIILVANTPHLSIYLLIQQILIVCQLLTRRPASERYRQTKDGPRPKGDIDLLLIERKLRC